MIFAQYQPSNNKIFFNGIVDNKRRIYQKECYFPSGFINQQGDIKGDGYGESDKVDETVGQAVFDKEHCECRHEDNRHAVADAEIDVLALMAEPVIAG